MERKERSNFLFHLRNIGCSPFCVSYNTALFSLASGLEKPRKLDFVKGTNKVTGFLNVEKGADIYYTTNGDTPTTSSTKYTSGDISVSASATIKAIQVINGQSSDVASWTNS